MLATPPAQADDRLKSLAEKYEFYVNIDPYRPRQPAQRYVSRVPEGRGRDGKKVLVAPVSADPSAEAFARFGIEATHRPLTSTSGAIFKTPAAWSARVIPSVLTDGKTPFVVTPPWPGAQKTGARLALARWLVRPENPLTARVWVNRLWQHHFGSGIVATVENFGRSGALPTHPELLDWLALQLVERGWSSKAIHRLVMTSNAYRQSSRVTPEAGETRSRQRLVIADAPGPRGRRGAARLDSLHRRTSR